MDFMPLFSPNSIKYGECSKINITISIYFDKIVIFIKNNDIISTYPPTSESVIATIWSDKPAVRFAIQRSKRQSNFRIERIIIRTNPLAQAEFLL